MLNRLPAFIDPLRLADEGARLVGNLSTRSMRRLAAVTSKQDAAATVDLQFDRSPQGLRQMQGKIIAKLYVTCQRCLQEMPLDLMAEPMVILLSPDESAKIGPEEGDLLVVHKPLALAELVEEELLLAMPMIPKHADEVCRMQPSAASGTPATGPFASLNVLKK